jgi:tRNA uridine 5-carbamoylmethylation protein Kti12
MAKVKILQGIPASGKSTWAHEFVKTNKDWVIVSRDALRHMRGEYWLPKQEGLITRWEHDAISTALELNYNVIVDATNLNEMYLKVLETKIIEAGHTYEIMKFNITLDEAIQRDIKRANGVGEKVIREFWEKYIEKPVPKLIQNKSLPKVIICDIDGTIADKGNRSAFDWERVNEDTPKDEIINIVKAFEKTHEIIFFSGRENTGNCYTKTLTWLIKNVNLKSNDYTLIMRKENDNRKDTIVKKEMFLEHIQDKYYVEFILDDRQQVVDMWRNELGLTCLQVDYGNF